MDKWYVTMTRFLTLKYYRDRVVDLTTIDATLLAASETDEWMLDEQLQLHLNEDIIIKIAKQIDDGYELINLNIMILRGFWKCVEWYLNEDVKEHWSLVPWIVDNKVPVNSPFASSLKKRLDKHATLRDIPGFIEMFPECPV